MAATPALGGCLVLAAGLVSGLAGAASALPCLLQPAAVAPRSARPPPPRQTSLCASLPPIALAVAAAVAVMAHGPATKLGRITSAGCIRPVWPNPGACCDLPAPGLGLEPIFRRFRAMEQGNGAREGETGKKIEAGQGEGPSRQTGRQGQIGKADRTLLLADAERLQDFDHAGRVQAALHPDAGEYFQG